MGGQGLPLLFKWGGPIEYSQKNVQKKNQASLVARDVSEM